MLGSYLSIWQFNVFHWNGKEMKCMSCVWDIFPLFLRHNERTPPASFTETQSISSIFYSINSNLCTDVAGMLLNLFLCNILIFPLLLYERCSVQWLKHNKKEGCMFCLYLLHEHVLCVILAMIWYRSPYISKFPFPTPRTWDCSSYLISSNDCSI